MIRWTGLAPWEFEFPFPGSLTPTFLISNLKQVKNLKKGSTKVVPNSFQAHPAPQTLKGYLAHKKPPTPLGFP